MNEYASEPRARTMDLEPDGLKRYMRAATPTEQVQTKALQWRPQCCWVDGQKMEYSLFLETRGQQTGTIFFRNHQEGEVVKDHVFVASRAHLEHNPSAPIATLLPLGHDAPVPVHHVPTAETNDARKGTVVENGPWRSGPTYPEDNETSYYIPRFGIGR